MLYGCVRKVENGMVEIEIMDIRRKLTNIEEECIGKAKIEIFQNGWVVGVDVKYNVEKLRDRIFEFIKRNGFSFKENEYFRI